MEKNESKEKPFGLPKLDEVRDKLGFPKEEREEILNPEIEKELNEATTLNHLFRSNQ